jgi:hypothetical protein
MAPSYSERQAQYAAWRDRLRKPDDVIELDEEPKDDRWDPAALFRSSDTIDLDAPTIDLDADASSAASDQHR